MSHDVKVALAKLGIVFQERKSGLWADCPACGKAEKWSIAHQGRARGKFHCFAGGCQFGGHHLWQLVARKMKFDLDEDLGEARAERWLSEAGTELPPEPMPEGVRIRLSDYGRSVFEMPSEAIVEPLERWVTPARRYAEARLLADWQVRRWGIGYAVDGRLAGRLVIPVRDARGRLLNYMARSFTGSKKRYLYPASVDGVDYDGVFGEQHWPRMSERRRERVFVAEGAINALAAEASLAAGEAPTCFVGALGGSGVRDIHVAKLATFGEVVVLKDPDAAGDSASTALFHAVARVARARCVEFPEGEDASSLHTRGLLRQLLLDAA